MYKLSLSATRIKSSEFETVSLSRIAGVIYSLWSWGVEEQLLFSSSCLSPGQIKKLQKLINFCLKVGHSANLKHSKPTWRQRTYGPVKVTNLNIKRSGQNARSAPLNRSDVRERSIYDNCRFDIGCSRASRLITKVSTPEWYICISQCQR